MSLMQLAILLPHGIFADLDDVERVVVETRAGSFGLLPRRLDCVAALSAGILTYQRAGEEEVHVAVDEGVLIKQGTKVQVSVRQALGGTDLGELRARVEKEFLTLDEDEKNVRSVLAKLESGFLHRLATFQNE